jgi:hypothetical protein
VISPPYRWRDWASDEEYGATGEDLVKFVNDGLLPALRGLFDSRHGETCQVCWRVAGQGRGGVVRVDGVNFG